MSDVKKTIEIVLSCLKAQIKEPSADKRIKMGKDTWLKLMSLESEKKAKVGII